MSQGILMEVDFFVNSLFVGIIITFAYDWLLILRKCIRHNIIFISVEDILFWLACAIGVFYVLYHENNGILRWFAILAATIGMYVYKQLVSPLFVKITSDLIIKTFKLLIKPIMFIFRQILYLLRRIFRFLKRKYILSQIKAKKVSKIAKKKLTLQARLIKIYLCKQEKQIRDYYGKKGSVSKKRAE